ncbi:hypothetical protein AXK60_14875 [Tsukamurella pseudospumae]|uniref:Uncharacterized protein n=1 Tax=Tsukamurella pseudospumae TaxID=239498 RepID=A0A137ZY99_9ACTN|nr:hypothetical protein AXK61_19220 [Tsukamurella pseudospumae]KXP03145.1 hypothetical protein AXK60_14875 [Tsukamurella pseudospumae]
MAIVGLVAVIAVALAGPLVHGVGAAQAEPRYPALSDFHALRAGEAPTRTGRVPVTVRDLGQLVVRSGLVEASDPYVSLGQAGRFAVPNGTYRVVQTVADMSKNRDGSNRRIAYLSLVLSDRPTTRVELAVPPGKPAPTGDKVYGVAVDAGMVAFADGAAIRAYLPTDDDPSAFIKGSGMFPIPGAQHGENIAVSDSGWGDGFYPVLVTRAADGSPTGLHIDTQVLGVL